MSYNSIVLWMVFSVPYSYSNLYDTDDSKGKLFFRESLSSSYLKGSIFA